MSLIGPEEAAAISSANQMRGGGASPPLLQVKQQSHTLANRPTPSSSPARTALLRSPAHPIMQFCAGNASPDKDGK